MLLKKIENYKEYQDCLEKVEKIKIDLNNQKKFFEELKKANLSLKNSLGIEKIGEQVNFEQLEKVKQRVKIAKREIEITNEIFIKVEKELKETIEKIRKDRVKKAKIIGLKLSKKIVKAIDTIEKVRSIYTALISEIKNDCFEVGKSLEQTIGEDPRNKEILNIMDYPTSLFLKNSEMYQKGIKKTRKPYKSS